LHALNARLLRVVVVRPRDGGDECVRVSVAHQADSAAPQPAPVRRAPSAPAALHCATRRSRLVLLHSKSSLRAHHMVIRKCTWPQDSGGSGRIGSFHLKQHDGTGGKKPRCIEHEWRHMWLKNLCIDSVNRCALLEMTDRTDAQSWMPTQPLPSGHATLTQTPHLEPGRTGRTPGWRP